MGDDDASGAPPASAGRRGRPPQHVEDDTPHDQRFGGIRPRVAWLLRISRLAHDDGVYASARPFVARLRELGISADPSRVSRWESAAAATIGTAETYERALGLPPGRLGAVLRGVQRSLSAAPPTSARRAVDDRTLHARLDDLLERVGGGPATGADWFSLATALEGQDRLYLPRTMWRDLSDRLVDEMARSVGSAYVTRFEALRGLLGHPGAEPAVLRGITAFATAPDCQAPTDPISLLQEVRSRQVTETVTALLTHQNRGVRRGAAWTAAVKILRRQIDGDQLRGVVVGLGHAAALDRDVGRDDIRDVLTLLPVPAQQAVLRELARNGVDPAPLRPDHGTPSSAQAWRRLATRLATRTAAIPGLDEDPLLARLVEEALGHPFVERRHQAALLLMCSPYCRGLAGRAAAEVPRSTPEQARALLRLLSYLSGPEQADALYGWASGDNPVTRAGSLVALAHLRHRLRADRVLPALDAEDPVVRANAMYALGMGGAPQLAAVADDPARTTGQAGAARWWLAHGPALFDPV